MKRLTYTADQAHQLYKLNKNLSKVNESKLNSIVEHALKDLVFEQRYDITTNIIDKIYNATKDAGTNEEELVAAIKMIRDKRTYDLVNKYLMQGRNDLESLSAQGFLGSVDPEKLNGPHRLANGSVIDLNWAKDNWSIQKIVDNELGYFDETEKKEIQSHLTKIIRGDASNNVTGKLLPVPSDNQVISITSAEKYLISLVKSGYLSKADFREWIESVRKFDSIYHQQKVVEEMYKIFGIGENKQSLTKDGRSRTTRVVRGMSSSDTQKVESIFVKYWKKKILTENPEAKTMLVQIPGVPAGLLEIIDITLDFIPYVGAVKIGIELTKFLTSDDGKEFIASFNEIVKLSESLKSVDLNNINLAASSDIKNLPEFKFKISKPVADAEIKRVEQLVRQNITNSANITTEQTYTDNDSTYTIKLTSADTNYDAIETDIRTRYNQYFQETVKVDEEESKILADVLAENYVKQFKAMSTEVQSTKLNITSEDIITILNKIAKDSGERDWEAYLNTLDDEDKTKLKTFRFDTEGVKKAFSEEANVDYKFDTEQATNFIKLFMQLAPNPAEGGFSGKVAILLTAELGLLFNPSKYDVWQWIMTLLLLRLVARRLPVLGTFVRSLETMILKQINLTMPTAMSNKIIRAFEGKSLTASSKSLTDLLTLLNKLAKQIESGQSARVSGKLTSAELQQLEKLLKEFGITYNITDDSAKLLVKSIFRGPFSKIFPAQYEAAMTNKLRSLAIKDMGLKEADIAINTAIRNELISILKTPTKEFSNLIKQASDNAIKELETGIAAKQKQTLIQRIVDILLQILDAIKQLGRNTSRGDNTNITKLKPGETKSQGGIIIPSRK